MQVFQLLTVNKERIAVFSSLSTKVMSGDPAAASDRVAAAPNLLQQSELAGKYASVFNEIGRQGSEIHLEAHADVQPVRQPCRKILIALKAKVKAEPDRMVQQCIIV